MKKSQPTRLRHRAAPALLGALVLFGAAFGATRALSEPARPAPAAARERALPGAELALSYRSGGALTELEIGRAQAAAKKTPAASEPFVELGLLFMRRQRETGDASLRLYADDALKAAAARAPDSPRVLAVRTMALIDQHRFGEARDLARRVIAKQPEDPSGHILYGDAVLELGDYESAGDAFQRALDLKPDLRSYERGAHLRWLHGDDEGALELFGLALDAGSVRDAVSSAWCWVELGALHLGRGRSGAALAAAERARALVDGYPPAELLAARALWQKGEKKRAGGLLERLVERAPSAELLLELAELESAEGKKARAAALREQAERLSGHEPLPVALHLARHGERPGRALELAERELALRSNIAAHDAHALALLRAGRIDEARRAIEKALRFGTKDARFVLHEGLILEAAGERSKARERLERATSLNPRVDKLLVAELRDKLDQETRR